MSVATRFIAALGLISICGCATTAPPPIAYLSLEKPKGIIQTAKQKDMNKTFGRGGWYFWNYNFRPAADLQSYIEEAQKETNATILRDADVLLHVPVAFDILFFGFNHADDSIVLKADASGPQEK